jgi:hypothetical protein
MNYKLLFLFFFTLSQFYGFGQKQNRSNCSGVPKGGYEFTEEAKFSILEDKSIFINEIQYYCVYSAMLSMQAMYENFGRWDYLIKATDKGSGNLLFWNDIKLFKNENIKYTIIARGKEDYGYIYCSYMVLDQNGNDVLTNKESIKKFKKRLGSLIKNANRGNEDFYKNYWTAVDPAIWKKIQEYKSNRPKNNN